MNSAGSQQRFSSLLESAKQSDSWITHLKGLVSSSWRPGEFDFEQLVFAPDEANPRTTVMRCSRNDCGVVVSQRNLCSTCLREWATAEDNGTKYDVWLSSPRVRRELARGCSVPECKRQHSKLNLCHPHASSFRIFRKTSAQPTSTVEDWLRECRPVPGKPPTPCIADGCNQDRERRNGLCQRHFVRYDGWSKRGQQTKGPESLGLFLEREVEPPMDPESKSTFGSAAATPFGLLPEPLRWEFLYAVQQRDLQGRAHIAALQLRATYLSLRRSGRLTAVGDVKLGRTPRSDPTLSGMLTEWQRIIDEAHRGWSGVDERDDHLIYLLDLPLKETTLRVGPNAAMDLRTISHDWVFDAVTSWVRSAEHGPATILQIAAAWTTADEALALRGTPKHLLGSADMDAVVRSIRKRWPSEKAQSRHLMWIERIIQYARSDGRLRKSWKSVPAAFNLDRRLHTPSGTKSASPSGDEPFRFVPQPILDWIMDRLHLIDRGDPYLTAEARAMIFVLERCGRRTGETTRLKDDCLAYDTQLSPYLTWTEGKPPYGEGKRLPMHQETHDVIRQWQDIKSERGIRSKWLFPSQRYSGADHPYQTSYLRDRLREHINAVIEREPFIGKVEGAEGNQIYFDLSVIDPYSFRHAFAQRLADATDSAGNPTTPPDVLQEFMGHRNFNTTMAYYEVTYKRRKKALEAIPPRRLDIDGHVVPVDRERDAFGKIAVSLGHCSEPQNVAAHGQSCALEHSCESCPFFLVDPLERDGMVAKRQHIRVNLERARAIDARQHIIDHYEARIKACTVIIAGIDAYIDELSVVEQALIHDVLESMAENRRRATAPREIDLRALLRKAENDVG